MSPRSPEKPEVTALSQTYRDLQEPGSDRCPSAEELASVAMGDAPGGDRDRIADHAVSCRRCTENLQILMRTHLEAAGTPEPRKLASLTWIAAAAIAAIAIGAVLWTRANRPDEALRGGGASVPGLFAMPVDGAVLAEP